MTWTDEELVAKSVGGDHDSFNELVLRWERPSMPSRTAPSVAKRMRGTCARRRFSGRFARSPVRGQAKFSSWLYRIALEPVPRLDPPRAPRARRAAAEDVDLIEMAAAAEPSESIEDLVARKDLSRLVEKAMALLPRAADGIVLKEYHGLTFQKSPSSSAVR